MKERPPAAKDAPPSRPGAVPALWPAVALIGRPNVGKSSLFNALLKREVSITDARAGTTRDRVLHPLVVNGRACDLVDTGGIGIVDEADLSAHIEQQIERAMAAATILVLVTDAKEGLAPLDREIARRLRKLGRPVLVAANKSEGTEAGLTVGEFAALGFPNVIPVSALHRRGLDQLEESLAGLLPQAGPPAPDWEHLPKFAVAGRRNVGKSTFVNALARQERTIVSDCPGTTRDSVDVLLEKDGRRFCLIDTAGLRRIKQSGTSVEFYAQVRTERAIRRADVVLLMLEAREGFNVTDSRALELAAELFRPVVLVVNKWDAMPGARTGEYAAYLEGLRPGLRRLPICFTSALTGARCWQTLDVAMELYRRSQTRIPTPKLNQALRDCERLHEPPARKSRKPRLLYAVQVGVAPVTVVIRGRHTALVDERHKRYLVGRLSELLGLEEVPLRLLLRDSEAKRRERGA
jgi:GTP-binding protein